MRHLGTPGKIIIGEKNDHLQRYKIYSKYHTAFHWKVFVCPNCYHNIIMCYIEAISRMFVDYARYDMYIFYIISEETSIFAPQRIPFYMDLGVAACTVGKVRAWTVFMCVCSTFRSSDFLLFVKNGFVVGVRCQGNREPPADGATTPLSQRHSWLDPATQ